MNTMQGRAQRYVVRPEGRRTTVPVHLPIERAWRWCVVGTLRDLRTSVSRNRVICLPNLRRLWCRRWSEVCWANDLADDCPRAISRQSQGIEAVTSGYSRETHRGKSR